jgi:hypothetical protein
MSAQAPTPHPKMPRRRTRVVKSNRTQILLFSILTLILTVAVVWGGRDGLDTFKLGYEFVRDEITLRREHLKRHAAQDHAQDDKVVVVKTAQSA